jgi:cytochrome c
MDQSGKVKEGPPLWDIVGRPKASFGEFKYSPALQAVGGEWTYEALNNFLAHPAWTIPGTSIVMRGSDPRDRADIISFLRTLSNNPVPLRLRAKLPYRSSTSHKRSARFHELR